MSNITITSTEEFEDSVNKLNGYLNEIRDLFNEENKSINEVLSNPHAWSGNARNTASDKYTELSNMYPQITESLENFIRFLATTVENYKEFEQSVITNLENNSDTLDVNS